MFSKVVILFLRLIFEIEEFLTISRFSRSSSSKGEVGQGGVLEHYATMNSPFYYQTRDAASI